MKRSKKLRMALTLAPTLSLVFALNIAATVHAAAATPLSGAIFTTTPDGTIVNENVHYEDKRDVYLDGGPPPNAPQTAAGLPNGLYVFQVTEPAGGLLLSMDPAKCRVVEVAGGVIIGRVTPGAATTPSGAANPLAGLTNTYNPPGPGGSQPCAIDDNPPNPTNPGVRGASGKHDTNVDADHGPPAVVVQLMPYGTTLNPGNVYKAWITPLTGYTGKGGNLSTVPSSLPSGQQKPQKCPDFCAAADPGFGPPRNEIKTDNFKVKAPVTPPGMLHVRKFNDRNGNGVQDPGEPLITGWGISITDPLAVTNLYGTPVDIIAEPPGSYVVDENNPSGWVHTGAYLDGVFQGVVDPITVSVPAGSDHTVLFGNFRPAAINACKWFDFNRDGTQSGTNEVNLSGWPMTLTGTTFEGAAITPVTQSTVTNGCTSFTGLIEGTYTVTEGTPTQTNWSHTTPASVNVNLAPGDSATVQFGNVCVTPFQGGLTMGYWKTHTGLDSPPRDPTYDVLNGPGFIFLGNAGNGESPPEQQVDDETEARAVFDAAEASTADGVPMLKAQLLAAKLNVLKFPGFDLAQLPDGTTVGSYITQADQILDDLGNGIPHSKAEIIAVKDRLDAANNNESSGILSAPSPTPCTYTFS